MIVNRLLSCSSVSKMQTSATSLRVNGVVAMFIQEGAYDTHQEN